MRVTPDRNGRLQTPGAVFSQPHGPAALIVFGNGNFHQSRGFKSPQIPRQRRLIKPGARRQSTQRVVGSRRNLSHQPELSEA